MSHFRIKKEKVSVPSYIKSTKGFAKLKMMTKIVTCNWAGVKKYLQNSFKQSLSIRRIYRSVRKGLTFIYIFYFFARIFKTRKKGYTVLRMCKSVYRSLFCKIMESIIEHIHGESVLWNIIILVILNDLRTFVLRLFALRSFALRAFVTFILSSFDGSLLSCAYVASPWYWMRSVARNC